MQKNFRIKKYINLVVGTCMVVGFIIFMVILFTLYKSNINKDRVQFEIVYELNSKVYSVVYNTKNKNIFKELNLEKNITKDLIGEYVGEETIKIDSDGNFETFKIYKYANAPITEYDWTPRLIFEATNGEYYHALIASNYGSVITSVDEVKSVYGILSSEDIASITNRKGEKIVDRDFISQFYIGLFTNDFVDNEFLQENVFQNTGVAESEVGELYAKYADDTEELFVELNNGMVLNVRFTSHNYVEVFHGLYFTVDNSWLYLVSIFK